MKLTMTRPNTGQFLTLCLMALLTFGLVFANLHGVEWQTATPDVAQTSHIISATVAMQTIGAGPGGCGILVGAIGGVVALGLAGATVGFGAALAISATIHAGAILCAY